MKLHRVRKHCNLVADKCRHAGRVVKAYYRIGRNEAVRRGFEVAADYIDYIIDAELRQMAPAGLLVTAEWALPVVGQ